MTLARCADPAWYSTCLKTRPSQQRDFAEPTCGQPCILEEADSGGSSAGGQWRFGDRCISCDLMRKNSVESTSDAKFIPEWTLAPPNTCSDCNAQTQPTSGGESEDASQCAKAGGIQKGQACCPKGCGQCGGGGCSKRPGGAHCCEKAVLDTKKSCATNSAPCVVSSKPSGTGKTCTSTAKTSAMDYWCNSSCNMPTANCPKSKCKCSGGKKLVDQGDAWRE